MPSRPGSGCSSSTTCSRPAEPRAAAVQLVKQLKGVLAGLAFLIELVGLDGRSKLEGEQVHVVLSY